jgi:hypothetical protein
MISAAAMAQSSGLAALEERLQRLEEQNRQLAEEIRLLREQLTAAQPAAAPLTERTEVVERRTEDLAQSKVEADHRFPIQLTGMVLFNAYLNGRNAGDSSHPTTAALAPSARLGGFTLRQTVLGLKYQGPEIFGGGRVGGTLYMDFFAGTGTSLNQLLRIRVASLDLDWRRTSFSVGQEKPVIAPREPNSLAMLGVSPLTQAGNIWLWLPQARLEHRFQWGEHTGLRAQVGVVQTNEANIGVPAEYASTLGRSRPAWEGRFELWREWPHDRRVEFAPILHASTTLVGGERLPSRVYGFDWLVRPTARFDWSGTFFHAENTGVLGGLRPGVAFPPGGEAHTISGPGGWMQFSYRATPRLTFNAYAGQQSGRPANLLRGLIQRNRAYSGNIIYRLGPNVLAGLEAYQVRTSYFGGNLRLVPHYDLALAYLF